MTAGRVFLVGCGTAKRHLTLEGVRALKESDVILYDRLADKDILDISRGRKIYVGKGKGESGKQERINRLLYRHAKDGRTVARLKGGDSFLFARGFEEYDYLRSRGVDVSVIPGISAFQVLSELGIPLTMRQKSSSVSFITGSRAQDSSNYTGLDADTLVFYMPVGNLEKIVASVRKRKKKAYCMLVENAGRKNYMVIGGSLGNIVSLAQEAEVSPPALFVVSPVKRRLYANSVLTFRQKDREEETIKKLEGFKVANYPLYTVKHRRVRKPKAKVFAFTSPNAVESVLSQHRISGKFVAIGERTAEALAKFGIKAHVPKQQSSTGLMEYLKKYDKKDVAVYCSPRTKVEGYKKVYAYDAHYKKKAPGLRKLVAETDALVITSSEVLNTLCALAPVRLLNSKTIVVIGPKTAATAKKCGLHVDFMPEKPLISELSRLR